MLLARSCSNALPVLLMQNTGRRKRKKHATAIPVSCPLLAVAGRHGAAVFDVMRSEELSLLVGETGPDMMALVTEPVMCDQPCREEVCDACWVGNSILYLADKTSDVTEWSYATTSVRRSVSNRSDYYTSDHTRPQLEGRPSWRGLCWKQC